MTIFAETDRLILREILPEDENGFFELDADPEVHQFLGNKPIYELEQARETIRFVRQQYFDHGIGRWAMIEKETNRFVGWTGLKWITEPIHHHVHYYDLGYRLLRKYWGQGYATEAARASVEYGFTTMNLTEIYAMTYTSNLNSKKVLEKVGFDCMEIFNHVELPHFWFKMERNKYLTLKDPV